MISRDDRPLLVRDVDFFFLAWENKTLPTDKRVGKADKGEDGEWTGRLCYALFYVCIALKNIWFPSKCSIWNYGRQEKKCFHAQGIFFARMEAFTLCFVLSMVLRLDAEHIEYRPPTSLLKRKKGDICQPPETT